MLCSWVTKCSNKFVPIGTDGFALKLPMQRKKWYLGEFNDPSLPYVHEETQSVIWESFRRSITTTSADIKRYDIMTALEK